MSGADEDPLLDGGNSVDDEEHPSDQQGNEPGVVEQPRNNSIDGDDREKAKYCKRKNIR